jgi:transposase
LRQSVKLILYQGGMSTMVRTRRIFSREFKLQVVRELEGSKTLAQIVREYEIHQAVAGRWYREYQQYGDDAFKGNGHTYKEDARIAQLERKIGQLTMENDFLKKAIQGTGRNHRRGS